MGSLGTKLIRKRHLILWELGRCVTCKSRPTPGGSVGTAKRPRDSNRGSFLWTGREGGHVHSASVTGTHSPEWTEPGRRSGDPQEDPQEAKELFPGAASKEAGRQGRMGSQPMVPRGAQPQPGPWGPPEGNYQHAA